MKCVCGYEYERDHWDKEEHPDVGDRKFIRIEGDFTREIELNNGGTDKETVALYACPKCYTVKMG